jgi:hypothetical protein
MPAITGVEAEVPPTSDGEGLPDESVSARAAAIPEAQVLAVLVDPLTHWFCGVQKIYPGKFGEPASATSGLNRVAA